MDSNTQAIIFSDGDFMLRRMADDPSDYSLMARWLSDERVLAFYEGRAHPFTLQQVIETFAPRVMEEEQVIPCLMFYRDQPLGYLQFYPADPEEYQFEGQGSVYALDLFIGEPDFWGKGLGSGFVCRLISFLFSEKQADWVILDPHVDNPRAIRAYEKCGFQILKRLPEHEYHEGRYVDCWLMGVQRPIDG
jgi:aminoglycoside 6'-N-acetyltransferase